MHGSSTFASSHSDHMQRHSTSNFESSDSFYVHTNLHHPALHQVSPSIFALTLNIRFCVKPFCSSMHWLSVSHFASSLPVHLYANTHNPALQRTFASIYADRHHRDLHRSHPFTYGDPDHPALHLVSPSTYAQCPYHPALQPDCPFIYAVTTTIQLCNEHLHPTMQTINIQFCIEHHRLSIQIVKIQFCIELFLQTIHWHSKPSFESTSPSIYRDSQHSVSPSI